MLVVVKLEDVVQEEVLLDVLVELLEVELLELVAAVAFAATPTRYQTSVKTPGSPFPPEKKMSPCCVSNPL